MMNLEVGSEGDKIKSCVSFAGKGILVEGNI